MQRQIHKIRWEPTPKQNEAFEYLTDKTTTELLYGGGAGGGKSYLGCAWLMLQCLQYPDTAWLMGRAVLKDLKQTTLVTFFEVAKDWGLKTEREFTYHAQDATIRWFNGATIYLKDLAAAPSDPEFESLGSMALTGAFIDECGQVSVKAKNIVISRIRHRLDEYKLTPKLLMASNPNKGFLYYDFYKPSKLKPLEHGALPTHRKFVPALVGDNPHISYAYKENLKRLDKVTKERLLYGNWEYDDDPAKLVEYDKILNMWTNRLPLGGKRYMIGDVARYGEDKTTFHVWDNWTIIHMEEHHGWSTKQSRMRGEELAEQYIIPLSNVCLDDDGVGGGIVDEWEGVRGFVNNSQARYGENYANLKSQCHFRMAERINRGEVAIQPEDFKDTLIEEIEQWKRRDADKDGKLALVSKETIKERLGRSPDHADTVAMREYFEVADARFEAMEAMD